MSTSSVTAVARPDRIMSQHSWVCSVAMSVGGSCHGWPANRCSSASIAAETSTMALSLLCGFASRSTTHHSVRGAETGGGTTQRGSRCHVRERAEVLQVSERGNTLNTRHRTREPSLAPQGCCRTRSRPPSVHRPKASSRTHRHALEREARKVKKKRNVLSTLDQQERSRSAAASALLPNQRQAQRWTGKGRDEGRRGFLSLLRPTTGSAPKRGLPGGGDEAVPAAAVGVDLARRLDDCWDGQQHVVRVDQAHRRVRVPCAHLKRSARRVNHTARSENEQARAQRGAALWRQRVRRPRRQARRSGARTGKGGVHGALAQHLRSTSRAYRSACSGASPACLPSSKAMRTAPR